MELVNNQDQGVQPNQPDMEEIKKLTNEWKGRSLQVHPNPKAPLTEYNRPLNNHFSLGSQNYLKITKFKTNYGRTIDTKHLQETWEQLNLTKDPNEKAMLTFDIDSTNTTYLQNSFIYYKLGCFLSPYTLLSVGVDYKNMGGLKYIDCSPMILHQLDNKTMIKGGVKTGISQTIVVGAKHKYDDGVEVEFEYEQDVSLRKINSSVFRAKCLLLDKISPYIEIQKFQTVLGVCFKRKLSERIKATLLADALLGKGLSLGKIEACLEYKFSKILSLQAISKYYEGPVMHNQLVLSQKVTKGVKIILGIEEKFATLRSVFGVNIRGFEIVLGIRELLEDVDFNTRRSIFGVFCLGLGFLIPRVLKYFKVGAELDKKDDSAEEKEKERWETSRKALGEYSRVILEKSNLAYQTQLEAENGLVILYGCYGVEDEVSDALKNKENEISEEMGVFVEEDQSEDQEQDNAQGQPDSGANSHQETVATQSGGRLGVLDFTTLLRFLVKNGELRFEVNSASLFEAQMQKIDANYQLGIMYRLGKDKKIRKAFYPAQSSVKLP